MNEQQPFEAIRKSDEAGREYWSARNLGPLLDYKEWRNFYKVIAKAIISCEASGHPSADHFVETNKMVELGSGASRNLEDFHLSRYACYLVVQNGDPSKPVIAAGQTYFALQTRRQELQDDQIFKSLREDEKRLFLRNELKEHNKHLVETAQRAGVETTFDFAVFQNHGYKGLYGGLDQKAARDFSFFMFMPVSFGAIILKLKHFLTSSTVATLWLPYLISFIVSGIVTYLALNLLFSILNKRKLNYFSYYCFIVGIIAILFL